MSVEPTRVVLVHRFFAPDVTTYAQMLDRYASHLSNLGHDVTVVCSPPSYNGAYRGESVPRSEYRDGFHIVRVRSPRADSVTGKTLGMVVFPLLVLLHLVSRRRPYDVVSVTTTPPVLMGMVGRLAKWRSRRTRLVYHCMDLYPEVARALGGLDNRALQRVAVWLDTRTVNAADQVIVLSQDMATTLQRRSVKREIAVANNFIMMDRSGLDETHEFARTAKVRFVFAGNLGRFQGIEVLIEAIRRVSLSRTDFEFVFLGAGALAGVLQDAAGTGLPIEVWPHRPLSQASAVIADADVAVVSLDRGVIGSAYPSKLLMYLEHGRPIMAVVEGESELARLVRDHDLGRIAEPGDVQQVAQVVDELIDDHENFDPGHIRRVGRDHFDPQVVMTRWTELYGMAPT